LGIVVPEWKTKMSVQAISFLSRRFIKQCR
jgi:hypothetical protein